MDLKQLEALGITKEVLIDRIINKIADDLLSGEVFDEDGNEFKTTSNFHRQLRELIQKRINTKVSELGEKYVMPKVDALVEGCVLQKTNQWGEKQGEPVTFIEYMIQRADQYMREEVDYEGKTRDEKRGYSWTKDSTRVVYSINKHLQSSIDTALKTALADANRSIVGGIEGAIKESLKNIQEKIKVGITVKQ